MVFSHAGTFHDSHTNPWSFRQHSAGGPATHAFSYLTASRTHAVTCRPHRWGLRRMNAASQTAFRLSPLREWAARSRANRFNVRTTSRTMYWSNCQRSVCAYFQRKWAGRRSNPRLRFFRPPLDRLSYQPILRCWVCPTGKRKKARCLCDTEPSYRKRFAVSECHVSNLNMG